jgi:hypothetical protein
MRGQELQKYGKRSPYNNDVFTK